MGQDLSTVVRCRMQNGHANKVAPAGKIRRGKVEAWQKKGRWSILRIALDQQGRSKDEIERNAKSLAQLASGQSVVKLGLHWHDRPGGVPSRWAGCTLDR